MTYLEWFRTIASSLNDDEPGRPFQRYLLKDMIAAYNRGMSIVFTYRPDLFTEYKKVKLVEGKYQDARGCCHNIYDVLEQVDARGNILKTLSGARKKAATAKKTWNKASCLRVVDADGNDVAYVIKTVDIDQNMNGRFTVDPPVPCGVDAYVLVKCQAKPAAINEAGQNGYIDNEDLHNTAVWHYVLASMLTGDRHATGASAEMQYHYRLFTDLLGIELKSEQLFESKEQA